MHKQSLRIRIVLSFLASLCIPVCAQSSLTITTTSVPNGTQGVAYSQQLYATGGTAPYTWSYGVGGPPSGMSLSSSGLLYGTPGGNAYPFQTTINLIVTDSQGYTATELLPITINPASDQPLGITTTSVPNGTQGIAYSQQLYVTGGTAPYTWSLGAQGPPSGISLSSSGLLSGTPTGNTYPYQAEINIIVTDSANHTATEVLALLINPASSATLTITTTSVPNGTEGVAYSQQLGATGGTAPYTWSIGNGGPPSSMSLSSSGLLSGTPTGNTYPYQTTINIIVTDSANNTASELLPILINASGSQPPLAITTTTVPNGTQGMAYSQQLYATGGTAPYTWSYGAQGPPSGISLSSSGLLSGTPTGNTYPYQAEINVIITDSSNNTVTEVLPLLINPASNQALAITTTSVPDGTQSVAYSQQLYVTGGTGPYTWSTGAQGPPSGVSLSSSGLLSGTPTGNTYPYQAEINVIVTDSASNTATEVLPLLINAANSLTITTTSVPNGTQGAAYSQQLAATGGTAPYTWSIGAEGPPSGISLSSSGLLTGTPTGNTYPYQAEINVIVTDNAGTSVTEVLPLLINAVVVQPLAITTTSVPNGTEGVAYSQQLAAAGGTAPYTWSIGTAGPPSGMSLSSSGLLSGTPSGNTYPFSTTINVIVTDSASNTASENLPITINASGAQTLAITTTSVPNGTQDVAYSQQLYATGGTAPYTWSIGTQGPPSGMSLSSSGLLSGTPSGGTYPLTTTIDIVVTDSASNTATESLPITIAAAGSQSTAIPASFLAVADYSTNQNVYSGDLAPFNTTWWLGGSQMGDEANQSQMVKNGYHFLPTFNTGAQAVAAGFFTAQDQGSCTTTATGCVFNTDHMTQTIQLAYSEIGPGGYYSIGNEEDNSSQDDVAPAVYAVEFQEWVNVIKGVDPTAHIVGPNMEQWSCCSSSSTNPYGTAGTWFSDFVTAYQQAYGTLPPLDVLSMHLYNTNAALGEPSVDSTNTEDANMLSDVQNLRQYANTVGYTSTPIWITEFGFVHLYKIGPQTPEQNMQAAHVVEELAAAAQSLKLQHLFWFTANDGVSVSDGLDPLYAPTASSSPYGPMPLSDLGQLVSNLVNNQTPLITSTSLPIGNTDVAYSQQLYALGGTPPYTWTAEERPAGISLSSSGVLSGTPTGSTTTEIDLNVTDSAGQTATEDLPFQINVLTIRTASVPNGTNGVAYSQQLTATGGTAPYTWSYVTTGVAGGIGQPPTGLSLSSSGLLSGTPDVSPLYPDAAEFWVDVVVTDSAGSTANEVLPILIDAPGIPQFAITTTSLPTGTAGQPYSYQLAATGGYIEESHAYTWSYGAQGPPTGIALSSSGLLSGTPVNAGQTPINVIVTDDVTNQATSTFTLTVSPSSSQSLAITTTSAPNATEGVAYSQQLNASGGTGSYTWTAASLPGGLSLSSTGVLFGTPSGDSYPETANISVTVTDSDNNTANEVLSLTIDAAGSQQTAIPASFIAVANYSLSYDSPYQNVYAGDLSQFNTMWWLGGTQFGDISNQTDMVANHGYHFLPIFDTGRVAVSENFFVPNPNDPNSCISTPCQSYNEGDINTNRTMRYTVYKAVQEVGPGGYYGVGNEESFGGSDDVAPDVYGDQLNEWVKLIKQYDPTAHIVGPNLGLWSCCGTGPNYNNPWGPVGTWFSEFVNAYESQNNGALPPFDVLSFHLYNDDTTSVQNAVSDTEADNFVQEVTNFRNSANSFGYTTAGTPIWITEMGFEYDIPGQTLVSPQNGQQGPHTADQNAQISRVINALAAAGPSLNLQRLFLFTTNDPYTNSLGFDPLYSPTAASSPSTPMPLTDYGQLIYNLTHQP